MKNKFKGIIIMSLLMLSMFFVLNPVSGATYTVNPGDELDLRLKVIYAQPGDTVYVPAGTYNLSPGAQVTVCSPNVSIIGSDPKTTIINSSTLGITDNGAQNGITIKNLTISNCSSGISADGNNWAIENCNIYQTEQTGILVSGNNAIIKNCNVNGGIFGIYAPLYAYNTTIENSVVSGITLYGIFVTANSGTTTIRNCLVDDNNNHGIYIAEGGVKVIENCTSTNNKGAGILLTDPSSGTNIINNCIVTNNSEGIVASNTNITYTNSWGNDRNNFSGTGSTLSQCMSVDAQYVDGVNTYYLSSSSLCVNKGSALASSLGLYEGFTTRADGKWDSSTVDMGYHYASNRGPPTSPPIAQILDIMKGNQE